MSDNIEILMLLMKQGISRILRYDLDWGNLGFITSVESMLFKFFMYFSTTFISNLAATLLVVMTISLLSNQM